MASLSFPSPSQPVDASGRRSLCFIVSLLLLVEFVHGPMHSFGRLFYAPRRACGSRRAACTSTDAFTWVAHPQCNASDVWSECLSLELPQCGASGATDGGADSFLSHKGALECLADRHVVLVGDSTMRFQYASLAHWLHTGQWASGTPPGESDGFPSWSAYHSTTNARLGGWEICDCHRIDVTKHWDVRGIETQGAIEARYYVEPRSGLRVTFILMFGHWPVLWHKPSLVGAGACHERYASRKRAERADTTVRASLWNGVSARTACPQKYCAVGDCGPVESADNEGALNVGIFADGLERLIGDLEPTDFIINSGFWEHFDSPNLFGPLFAASEKGAATVTEARRARGEPASAPRLYWRTTQATVVGSRNTFVETALLAEARSRGWTIVDNGLVSAGLCKFAVQGTSEPWDHWETGKMNATEYDAWCDARVTAFLGDGHDASASSFVRDDGGGARSAFTRARGPLWPAYSGHDAPGGSRAREAEGLYISENHVAPRLYKAFNQYLLMKLCGNGDLAECPVVV